MFPRYSDKYRTLWNLSLSIPLWKKKEKQLSFKFPCWVKKKKKWRLGTVVTLAALNSLNLRSSWSNLYTSDSATSRTSSVHRFSSWYSWQWNYSSTCLPKALASGAQRSGFRQDPPKLQSSPGVSLISFFFFTTVVPPERHQENKNCSITSFLFQAGAPLKPITDNAVQSMWTFCKVINL